MPDFFDQNQPNMVGGTDPNSNSGDLTQMLLAAGLNRGGMQGVRDPLLPTPGATGSALQTSGIAGSAPGSNPMGGWQQGQSSGFDPATAQAMLALHGQANQQANIARSRKLADQMRQDAGGLMQGKQVGRVYAGPKWWDAAANIGANWQAGRMDKQANADSAGLDDQYKTTMGNAMDEFNRRRNWLMGQT